MRLLIPAIIVLSALGGAALARTVLVGPQACFLAADADPYAPPKGVEAADLNPGRAVADQALVIFDVPLRDGWASRRLFARLAFAAEPERPAPLLPCGGGR